MTDDDVAVQDSLYTAGRRGVGITVLAEKIVGAAAEEGHSLSEVAEICRRVNAQGRSMGMALTSCTVPAAGSPTFYEFDSTELLALYKDMDARDEEPVVVYHSHTATEAYPSRTDIGLAMEPAAHYVLVSTREHGNNDGPVEFRSYRIVDGVVTEEEVTVVDGAPENSL